MIQVHMMCMTSAVLSSAWFILIRDVHRHTNQRQHTTMMMISHTLQRHSRATCSNATPLSPISARSCVGVVDMMDLVMDNDDDDDCDDNDGTNASA